MVDTTEMEFICRKCNRKMALRKSFVVNAHAGIVGHHYECICGEKLLYRTQPAPQKAQ